MLSCFSCGDTRQVIVLMLMCELQSGQAYLPVLRSNQQQQQLQKAIINICLSQPRLNITMEGKRMRVELWGTDCEENLTLFLEILNCSDQLGTG